MKHIGITLAGGALVAALGLAGCGGGSGGGGDGGGSESGAAVGAGTSTVKVSDSPVGDILVDGSGRTLYLFTADGQNTNSMRCDAACLKLWPPLEGRPKAGSGADAHLVGTTKGDGRSQATYAGHPLYYYADDKAAGDLKGQGIDKIWYVLDPHGAAIKAAVPSGSGSSDGGGGGGYSY